MSTRFTRSTRSTRSTPSLAEDIQLLADSLADITPSPDGDPGKTVLTFIEHLHPHNNSRVADAIDRIRATGISKAQWLRRTLAARRRLQAWRDAKDRRDKAWGKEWKARCAKDPAYAAKGWLSADADWRPLRPFPLTRVK